jgi:hypothetical protein
MPHLFNARNERLTHDRAVIGRELSGLDFGFEFHTISPFLAATA